MAEIKFAVSVKYKGVRYVAHTPFECEDDDLELLVKQGAITLSSPKPKDVKKEEKVVEEVPLPVEPKKTARRK